MKNIRPITTLAMGGKSSTMLSAHMASAICQLTRVMKFHLKNLAVVALCFGLTPVCRAQNAPATPVPAAPAPGQTAPPAAGLVAAASAAPTPATALPTPSITGPLAGIPPVTFDAGPFGKIAVNGILNGYALGQGNYVSGDNSTQATLGNGQVWIQKTDGWFQFYLQAGAYTLPALATPYLSTGTTLSNFYGPLPTAYLKLVPGKNTSILIGELPTLIGAEYTFSFENMNIERGLLWNQENAISRGMQVNQTMGKYLTASLSWNDGFYSNRYTWLTGSLTFTKGPHALSFVGGGNYDKTAFQTLATPVQNNSSIYNVIYTFTKGPWIIQPYFQYTDVPTNLSAGIKNGATTQGEAILLSHAFKHGFSLAGRGEYLSSSGSVAQKSVNLMFGPGSSGASVTVTPTFQLGGFFVRGDISYVHAGSFTPGYAFGGAGLNDKQVRAVGEIGFMFGNNLIERKQ
jgi:hypothetical protein